MQGPNFTNQNYRLPPLSGSRIHLTHVSRRVQTEAYLDQRAPQRPIERRLQQPESRVQPVCRVGLIHGNVIASGGVVVGPGTLNSTELRT